MSLHGKTGHETGHDRGRPLDQEHLTLALNRSSPSERFEELLDLFEAKNQSLFGDVRPDCVIVCLPDEAADMRVSNPRFSVREREALERDLDIHDWDARTEPYFDRQFALEVGISETPAQSVAGLAAKMRLYAHLRQLSEMKPEEMDDRHQLPLSVLADAERLAGRVAS